MAELTEHPLAYAEEHPYVAAAVIVGAIVVVYWLFFSGGSSSASASNTSQTNMAAAYYAAEAAQATAGTQLNIAQDQTQAAVKIAALQAGGAVAINNANATAATSIAGSMYNANVQETQLATAAETTQAGYAADVAKTQAYYGYATAVTTNAADNQTSQVQANDAVQTAAINGQYATQVAQIGATANEADTAMSTIIPQELGLSGGFGNFIIPGAGYATVNTGAYMTPNQLASQGFTGDQINSIIKSGQYGNYPVS